MGMASNIKLWRGPAPPSPARDHEDALARFHRARAGTDSSIRVDCLPQLLTHGHKTERAVVLLHGFTNCPKQFDSLAVLLYERDCNVYLPRVPRHGISDRMTTALTDLTAEEMTACAESALDLAHGLGNRVTVVGLSSTAVATAWLAARRADVDEAVLIAPSLGPRGVSLFWTRRLTSTLLVLPNFFVWWDSKLKGRVPGPTQCYPRFSSRALAQVYRLGLEVIDAAGHVIVRIRWWGGIEPCEILDSVAVARDGSTFTITARVGSPPGEQPVCIAIARDTATLVDLGVLASGRYTVRPSAGDASPITVTVP